MNEFCESELLLNSLCRLLIYFFKVFDRQQLPKHAQLTHHSLQRKDELKELPQDTSRTLI
jgi:hypothetical protein